MRPVFAGVLAPVLTVVAGASLREATRKLDCFVAEPVIGRRFAPTR